MNIKRMAFLAALPLALGAMAVEPPTMGWSSWNTYRVHISDSIICAQAKAMVDQGLAAVGYKYINIDDGFFGGRDANGTLVAHPARFPKGLRPVVDYVHSLGLKAGIYSDAGGNTCGNFWDHDTLALGVGFYGHDQQDANFYFLDMGFDFVKIDFCGGDRNQNWDNLQLSERERYIAIRKAIENTGRKDVRVNICRWAYPGTWVTQAGTSWRIAGDISPNWGYAVQDIIRQNRWLSAYAKDGCYNDMDMLEIGRGLTDQEERSHFGLWCIQSNPLLIGCDLTKIPQKSLDLLKNTELIAINQDPLGLQARVAKVTDSVYLYVKDVETLNGKKRVVAVYNPTQQRMHFSFNAADVCLKDLRKVRDLFAHANLPVPAGDQFELDIDSHDTQIYMLEAKTRLERTVYEAETAYMERYQELKINNWTGYADYVDSKACSGWARVGFLGHHPDNWMEWPDVYSQKGGDYDMTIRYKAEAAKRFYYAINGSDPVWVETPAWHGHDYDDVTIRIHLNKGQNKIRLGNPKDWAPDIDVMTLKRID